MLKNNSLKVLNIKTSSDLILLIHLWSVYGLLLMTWPLKYGHLFKSNFQTLKC